MQNIKKIIVGILVGVVSSSGVMAAPKDVLNCKLYEAGVASQSVAATQDKRVIILELDGGGSREAEMADAQNVMKNGIDLMLSKAGVEVMDTNLIENKEIRDAIERYEMEGTSEFSTALATNAIGMKLTTVALSSSYSEASSYTLKGKTINNPAQCRHTATVRGVLNVYEINPLRLLHSVEFKDNESLNIDSSSRSCRVNPGDGARLIATAIEEGIQKQASKEVFTIFRTAGHIREVRMCGRTPYVWISTPPSRGATIKAKVKFFEQTEYIDQASGESFNRKRFIAQGKIIETQNPDEAWVKLKSKKNVKKLRIGHLAEIEQASSSCLDGFEIFCR